MAAAVHLFGVRHHGPGSARGLVAALHALQPATVLIEGPSDLSELLPMLARADMVTPVALLAYAEDDPGSVSFFPFADYSPEYQAVRWAVAHGARLAFIDLPATDRETPDAAEPSPDPVARDPIGALACAAGYADGESWWRDVIEENPAPGPVFAAVADAMTALRDGEARPNARDIAREAHMRLEIAAAARAGDGHDVVAVVCGAWHVPALDAKVSATADRALLKGRPRQKVNATWVPWTAPRLSRASGYGAGVVSPGWCQHVWETHDTPERETVWLARVADAMRARGDFVSTASVIEARRLATALAALRGRPTPGFEELREATIACLCFGERARWDAVAAELLVGSGVGQVPEDVPLAPLLQDLQRQQRATRLKPEALERELSLDLRSEAGLVRSTLLHRLTLLGVPWGRLADAGRSRGTFRENWVLAWEPEYVVRLVEHIVHGSTIEEAATSKLAEAMRAESDLGALAGLVRSAMLADLGAATATGIDALERKAALTSECQSLLRALPSMADVIRYGEARAGSAERLAALMPRLVVQAGFALPYAVRDLDGEAAAAFRTDILAADGAIALAALLGDTRAGWHDALAAALDDARTTRLVAGAVARLLYEAERLTPGAAAVLLGRMLSPGTPITGAAGFFDGFFNGAGQRLIHDTALRQAVDGWLVALESDDFTAHLPLFRRVFAALDKSERRRMMDALFDRAKVSGADGYQLLPNAAARWPVHEARILALLDAGAPR